MTDSIFLEMRKSLQASSGTWYKNIEVLGSGGNAVTFLVLCTSGANQGQLFAMKIFRKLSRLDRRESFLREVDFLKQYKHPAVMQVYDDGIYYDKPFVVAEYLPNTLREVIRTPPSIVKRVSYALQLLSALSFLSGLNPAVVHRDIKPENIFVKGGSCVLGDFGLMKLLDDDSDMDREIFKESTGAGMPYFYRTPDLVGYAKGENTLTTKTDMFQLGLVLAELFTGFNPERRPQSIYDPVELEPLRNIPSGFGAGIAALIRRMLLIDPGERAGASELMAPFESILFDAVSKATELDGSAF
jgi:serine/threonine protein kinase